jgi:hypothetical protein
MTPPPINLIDDGKNLHSPVEGGFWLLLRGTGRSILKLKFQRKKEIMKLIL